MHICVSEITIIDSDNGLSPGWRQAIIWNNAELLLIEPLGTNFNEILIKVQTFSLNKIRLKMLSAKCRPFCLGLSVLRNQPNSGHDWDNHYEYSHSPNLPPTRPQQQLCCHSNNSNGVACFQQSLADWFWHHGSLTSPPPGIMIIQDIKADQKYIIRSSDNDSTGLWPPGLLHTLGTDGYIQQGDWLFMWIKILCIEYILWGIPTIESTFDVANMVKTATVKYVPIKNDALLNIQAC